MKVLLVLLPFTQFVDEAPVCLSKSFGAHFPIGVRHIPPLLLEASAQVGVFENIATISIGEVAQYASVERFYFFVVLRISAKGIIEIERAHWYVHPSPVVEHAKLSAGIVIELMHQIVGRYDMKRCLRLEIFDMALYHTVAQ